MRNVPGYVNTNTYVHTYGNGKLSEGNGENVVAAIASRSTVNSTKSSNAKPAKSS